MCINKIYTIVPKICYYFDGVSLKLIFVEIICFYKIVYEIIQDVETGVIFLLFRKY